MPVRSKYILAVAALLATLPLVPTPASGTSQSQPAQPPLDPKKIDYTPIGYYGPPDEADTPAGESATVPTPGGGPPPLNDPNPSGKYVAYDTDVWESLTIPYRHPGDNCNAIPADERATDAPFCLSGDEDDDATDPVARTGYTGYAGPGGVSTVHGTCPPMPDEIPGPWGECFNNQLEYLDYYEHTMETMLADFGGTVHRYPFFSPGTGSRGQPLDASGGQAYNIGAVVPGADHPEQTVIVGAHYDFTDSGPAAAWDSAEGHTEVIRMAKIMSDYWRATGTRPSATIKFMPWDSEESGTFGSIDYVTNNIPPGEEGSIRGYFNVDPCAGAYPAYKDGNFALRVPEVLQLANPANYADKPEVKAKIEAFNTKAESVVDQVLEYLDDSITTPAGEVPIFVSNAEATAGNDGTQAVSNSDRDMFVTALGGLAIFTSDYGNFQAIGVPIFNMFPDYFGPHADGTPASTEGISILHTNNDNLLRINRLTSGLISPGNLLDPTGTFASEGWAKGMEMCAQMNSWGMLQPEMAGAQTSNTNPVAYFEALPNEAIVDQSVSFDANGSYQYANTGSRTLQPESALTFEWDFGDGATGSGKVASHAYSAVGKYTAKLTVTGAGGTQDTMTIPITVIGSNFPGPALDAIPPADAEDGNFALKWAFEGTRKGFQNFRVEEANNFVQPLFDDTEGNITDKWEPGPSPGGPVQPWQKSTSAQPKVLGNKHRSGGSSYWTGAVPVAQQAGTNKEVTLTLKQAIEIPATGDATLTYWSMFAMELDDEGRVDVAIDTGDPATLDWSTVDKTTGTFCADESGSLTRELQPRAADLSPYKGKKVLIRFRWVLGPTEGNRCNPGGWYIDDIGVQAGTFIPVGTTAKNELVVQDRPNGDWAYRVLALYNDGVSTAPSNAELAKVTSSKSLPNADLARCLKSAGNTILGSAGKDTLVGTKDKDVLCGFDGNDRLNGKGGNDVIFGGSGNDRLQGGSGNDKIYGDKGKDVLAGGKGNDKLKGGPKADTLKGGPGKDTCGHNRQDTINC
jgi:PKD repeat protein